uniref:No apical meristem-associated C-terminal domain-containing protein n=1 Tax=Tanacetum cinerariifolium TaxID=118510 RepID=A0A6L2J2A5_TANCI|nr:hypothetical protein [Tanacetum cinerariifolium]
MAHTNFSQEQFGNSQQSSQEIEEEEDETEPILTSTSKKPGISRGKRVKSMSKKSDNSEPQGETVRVRNFWSQDEELLLAECFIQISEDLRTPMNREVAKFNALVNETKSVSGENDENLMTRIELLYQAYEKTNFKHRSAWNPESTQARRNRNRVTNKEPELFGDDALPRPPGMHRIAKSQRSSNSTASFGSNPVMFQKMKQQQMEIKRKEKIERVDREINSRVALNDSKRVTEDLKVLQISTNGMNPIDAAIVNAQKARIRALYHLNII